MYTRAPFIERAWRPNFVHLLFVFFPPGAGAHINFNKLIIQIYKGSGEKKE